MSRKILKQKNKKSSSAKKTDKAQSIDTQYFEYKSDSFTENQSVVLSDFKGFKEGEESKKWLNLHGLHNTKDIEKLADRLQLDRLTKQAIFDINQRPKFQEYDNYCFLSIKSVLPTSTNEIKLEQISFILTEHYLVSLQEEKADYFEAVRNRIRNKEGVVRDRGVDYLLFVLLESILDNYFTTVNAIDKDTEDLLVLDIEKDLSPETLNTAEHYKRKIHKIKKTILPLKDILSKIERENIVHIRQENFKYFYELKDLCLYLLDETEQLDIRFNSYTNLFFSIQGHKMNQVMKTLTVVATIFIPLTFIAGIYGMNFKYIPELEMKNGYLYFWGIIGVVTAIMLVYFKRKRWF